MSHRRAVAAIAASYAIASVPVAYLAGRWRGVDVRDVGSGNVGASNIGESVSKGLMVPVGIAQIAQGLAGPMLARAAGQPAQVQAAAGLAAIAAHDWNPWLRFQGGRGVGPAIGFLLAMAPRDGLPAFVAVAVAGVPFKASAQSIAAGLVAAPLAAYGGGARRAVVLGCAAAASMVLLKRVLANGAPAAELPRPEVWWTRLVYDRDIRDREAWVRRGLGEEGAESA